MAIWEIEDEQGRLLEIEGDVEPTGDDLDEIFKQLEPPPPIDVPEADPLETDVATGIGDPYQQLSEYAGTPTSRRDSNIIDEIVKSFNQGDKARILSEMTANAQEGKADWKEVQKFRREYEDMVQKDPVKADSFLAKGITGVAGMAPMLIKGWYEGKKGAAAGATAGAGAALLAGQLGPQIATPEEVVTVPGAAALGAGIGGMSGAVNYWRRQGAAETYSELIDSGLDEPVANLISQVAGIPYAFLEYSQFARAVPGVKKLQKVAANSIIKGALKVAGKWGIDVTEQTIEEALQKALTSGAAETGRYIDGQKGSKDVINSLKKVANDMWVEAKTALPSMVVMLAPTGIHSASQMPGQVREERAKSVTEEMIKRISDIESESTQETLLRPEDLTAQPSAQEAEAEAAYQDLAPTEEAAQAAQAEPVTVPQEIINPVAAIDAELQVAETDRERALLEEKKETIVDDLFNEEGAVAYSTKEGQKAVRKLDEAGIAYSYGRLDIEGMNTTNAHAGSHAKADVLMRQVIGQGVIKDIIDAGGIVFKGTRADEIRYAVPNASVDQLNGLVENAQDKGLEARKQLGLDKLTHLKYDIPNYGALDITYAVVEGQPGKYGEMDREADALEGSMKEIKLALAREKPTLRGKELNDVTREMVRKARIAAKRDIGTGVSASVEQRVPKRAKSRPAISSKQAAQAATKAKRRVKRRDLSAVTLLDFVRKNKISYDAFKPFIGKTGVKSHYGLMKRGGMNTTQLWEALEPYRQQFGWESPDDLANDIAKGRDFMKGVVLEEGTAKPAEGKKAEMEKVYGKIDEDIPFAKKQEEQLPLFSGKAATVVQDQIREEKAKRAKPKEDKGLEGLPLKEGLEEDRQTRLFAKGKKAPTRAKTVPRPDFQIIATREAIPYIKKVDPEGKGDLVIATSDYVVEKGKRRKLKPEELGYVDRRGNKTIIVLNTVTDPKDFAYVLGHDIIGHYGAAKVFAANPKIKARVDAFFKRDRQSEFTKRLEKLYAPQLKTATDPEAYLQNEWLAEKLRQHYEKSGTKQELSTAQLVYEAVRDFVLQLGSKVGIHRGNVDDVMRNMIDQMGKPTEVTAKGVQFAKAPSGMIATSKGPDFIKFQTRTGQKYTFPLHGADVNRIWDMAEKSPGKAFNEARKLVRPKDAEAARQGEYDVQFAKKDDLQTELKLEARDVQSLFEKIKDVWFGRKDVRILRTQTEKKRHQAALRQALGLEKYTEKAKDYDRAIQIYIDAKRDPQAVEKYYDDLSDEQKRIVDLSQNLPKEIKAVADQISDSYKAIGLEAQRAEVIRNVLDNYVGRIWKLEGKRETETLRKFGTKTKHAKKRVFGTIIEGMANGFEPAVEGATSNLQVLKEEIIKVIEDRAFLNALTRTKSIEGDPLLTTKKLEGYVEIEHPNFIKWKHAGKAVKEEVYGKNFFVTEEGDLFEKQRLYAPKEQAKNLNKILGISKLRDFPGVKTVTKYNAIVKSWVLQTSLFHHLAFMRSYYLGTRGKTWSEMNLRQAYKAGVKAIENESPIVMLGVKNGLTLGLKQDWNEELLREKTFIGALLDKWHTSKVVKDKIVKLRERQADFLFGELGAGLKAKAFTIEFRNHMKSHPSMDPDEAAKHVANLINDDFGGLHLQRMGRSPTVQHVFRLLALAPDWTESNVRTMVKSVSAGGKAETELYRRFWAGILTKGIALTAISNLIFAAFDDDDEDAKSWWQRFVRNYQMAWKQGRLRHLDVDITPLYRALGGKEENRRYFSIIGHFKDPMKFIFHPVISAQHKGSIVYRTFYEAMAGVDWAQRRFTTTPEILGLDTEKGYYLSGKKEGEPKFGKLRGKTVTRERGPKGPLGYSRIPSYLLSQAKGSQPVQIQNLIGWMAGETAAFDAMARSMGLGVSRGRNFQAEATEKYEESFLEARELKARHTAAKDKKEFIEKHPNYRKIIGLIDRGQTIKDLIRQRDKMVEEGNLERVPLKNDAIKSRIKLFNDLYKERTK